MSTADWQVVGYSANPVPGDPQIVRSGGQRYRDIAASMRRVAAAMRALQSGTSSGAESVTALLDNRDEIVEEMARAIGRYQAAGDGLIDYALVLDQAQQDAETARSRAQTAESAAVSDGRIAARYEELARQARLAAEPDLDTVSRYERMARNFRDDEQAERAKVVRERQVVDDAVVDRNVAAQRAIDRITAATEGDDLNDSWWDDWGSRIVSGITQVAEWVAGVAGIAGLLLCWVPGLGAALLAISAVAGIVAAVGNTALALAGDQSWGRAFLSIGFALLGVVGLGGLRGIAGSLRGGMQFLGRGGYTALREGVRNGLPVLVSGLRTAGNALRNLRPNSIVSGTGTAVQSGIRGITNTLHALRSTGWRAIPNLLMNGRVRPVPSPVQYTPINPGPLADDVAVTFRSATYTMETLPAPRVLYRVHNPGGGQLGSYWTAVQPRGPLQAQLDLALNPAWGNSARAMTTIRVPAGNVIFEGVAAPQPILGGSTFLGGGSQIYIPRVDPGWVISGVP